MQGRIRLQILYRAIVLLVVVLVGYQIYLALSKTRFESLHMDQVERIRTIVAQQPSYAFAVVGNINNSSRIFGKQMIPELNRSGVAFVISAGNAVSGGAEENYRFLFEMLAGLSKPWLLTYGNKEESDFGDFRFYEYLGPHFFSLQGGDSLFVFLDGTGSSPLRWQLDGLRRELATSDAEHRFVFIGLPLHPPVEDTPVFEQDNYFSDDEAAEQLRSAFRAGGVDVVFSANLSLFHSELIDGVQYVTTGGAGGVIVDSDNSFHHYVRVQVDEDGIRIVPVSQKVGDSALVRTLDSVWSALYTFFYVSFTRFLIVVGVLILVGLKLRELIFDERDYYTHLAIDDSVWRERRKRVAFFTNNYFPFVSGVTISIHRLAEGLRHRGHALQIFAPQYDDAVQSTADCVRLRTLVAFGARRQFRLGNPVQSGIRRRFDEFAPDLVHVHHPFWLGWLGLWRARRARVPAVYTYHTRLEMYSHYVPLPGALFRNVISHVLVRRFCNRCAGVIVPTWSTEEYLRLIGVRCRLFVQPTGVEFERFHAPHRIDRNSLREELGLTPDDVVLISVSRLGREKNIRFLIDAARELQQRSRRSLKLVLVGDGEDRAFLEDRVAGLGLAEMVQFTGAVAPEDIPAYYQMADLFVFASKSETQGMVILEAMSAGLPVVAIRSSGIDDAVVEGKTGFKTLDDVAEWTTRVLQLVDDDEMRDRFAQAAVAFARGHDVDAFAANVDGFYSEVLALWHEERGS